MGVPRSYFFQSGGGGIEKTLEKGAMELSLNK